MENTPQKDELWIEKISKFTYLENLGKKFGYEGLGPYLFLWIFFIINTTLLEYLIFFLNPPYPSLQHIMLYAIPGLIGFTFAVGATKRLRDEYYDTLKDLNLSPSSNIFKLKLICYISGIVILLVWMLINAGFTRNPLTGAYNTEVILHFSVPEIFRYLIWVFVYLLIVVEIASYFLAINILLPRKIIEMDLNFSDPYRFAGLKRVGSILLNTTEIYFVALTLLNLTIYFAFSEIFWKSSVMISFFITAWILGIGSFLVPSFWIHKHMKHSKEKMIDEINQNIRELGSEPGGRLEVNPDNQEERVEYLFYYLEHEHLVNTKEYPFDASILQELVFAALVPISTELALTFLL